MKKTIAAGFLLVGIIIFFTCFSLCFAQNQSQTIQSHIIKGSIVDVDYICSKITVKYLQPDGNNDEITLGVTSHTKIDHGDLRIELTELNEGDEVTVEYSDDPMSFDAPKVSQINVKP